MKNYVLQRHLSTIYFFNSSMKKMSLSPEDVENFGCMWGQDNFQTSFSDFNIRIFVINLQSFGKGNSWQNNCQETPTIYKILQIHLPSTD